MGRQTMRKNIELTRRFFPYLKKYLHILVLVLFCTALTSVCELALPLIVRQITDDGIKDVSLLTPHRIALTALAYVAMRGVDALGEYVRAYVGHSMGVRIETDMRRDLFAHLQKMPFSFYDNTKIGQLMSRITTDLFDVAEWAHHFPEMVFLTLCKIIVGFFIFASMDVRFAVCIFAMLPFMIIFTRRSRMKMRDTFKLGRHQAGEINAQVEDSLLGVRVVRAFTNEEIEKTKFEGGIGEYMRIKRRNYRHMASFHTTVRLLDGMMYIAVVSLGAWFMHTGATTPGDFTASLLLVSSLLSSIRSVVDFSEQFSRGITGVERFTELMDIDPSITDSPTAVDITDVKGDIVFDNVSFSYVKEEKKILNNLNLHIKAGQNIAVVGPSGGGKTTLCNLIPRFYEIEGGEIRLDGQNIADITLSSLRRNIGVVAQDVYLFSGSVYDNIVYGRPDATRDEVVEAAKNAGAHEFICKLPDGYDTYIGERGLKLSGGQKQRISIARLFLKDPPILLLDEATSALDNESERLVQQSLERLAKGRTTLTIAHRLTTIRNADEIIVLTEDGITESGSHDELMKKGGMYAEFYKLYVVE